jgi:hypothetical protein
MTAYVIDPTSPLPPTSGQGEHALVLDARDTVMVGEGGIVGAFGAEAHGIRGLTGNTYLINGTVFSTLGAGILGSGTINVGAEGVIEGSWAAIEFTDAGTHSVLNNAGTIRGTAETTPSLVIPSTQQSTIQD